MPDKLEWIPILTELGEDIVARIIEKSPDAKSALLKAKADFEAAEKEAGDLRRKGHENEG